MGCMRRCNDSFTGAIHRCMPSLCRKPTCNKRHSRKKRKTNRPQCLRVCDAMLLQCVGSQQTDAGQRK